MRRPSAEPAPDPSVLAKDLVVEAFTALLRAPTAEYSKLADALDLAGQSAAPSRTSDADAERAMLLAAIGRNADRLGDGGVVANLVAAAARLRGARRADVITALRRLLQS
jgi:hypothetical protein